MGSRRAFVLGASALASGIGVPAAAASWMKAGHETQGFAAGALDRLFETGSLVPALRSLVVVRNGHLVGERRWRR